MGSNGEEREQVIMRRKIGTPTVVRLPAETVNQIDTYAKRLARGGMVFSRSDAIRILLHYALAKANKSNGK